MIERVSVEPSRRCGKGCAFCYNGSSRTGEGLWTELELTALAIDLGAHGVRSISFGGGEPLEVPWIFSILTTLRGAILRSLTTNGLPLLEPDVLDRLVRAHPDKVHVSIHDPENTREVERVIAQVVSLAERSLRSGVNVLVRRSQLDAATRAIEALAKAGIGLDRIVLLPMRGEDTPSPAEVARAAGNARFQSMTCLSACGKSPRFVSIDAERAAAWCSYTRTRRALRAPTHAALMAALDGLGLEDCASNNLVKLGARA